MSASNKAADDRLDRLWKAMLATEVRTGWGTIVPVGEPFAATAPPSDARYVVTAWNPGGELAEGAANEAAQAALTAELEALGVGYQRADGVALDGSWSEPSLWLVGATRAAVCSLGRRYGQVAVFEWSPSAATLTVVACDASRAVSRRAEVRPGPGRAGRSAALQET